MFFLKKCHILFGFRDLLIYSGTWSSHTHFSESDTSMDLLYRQQIGIVTRGGYNFDHIILKCHILLASSINDTVVCLKNKIIQLRSMYQSVELLLL